MSNVVYGATYLIRIDKREIETDDSARVLVIPDRESLRAEPGHHQPSRDDSASDARSLLLFPQTES